MSLLDDDGEVKHLARTSDPLPRPPTSAGEDDQDDQSPQSALGRIGRRMREHMAQRQWIGLGLDPADDGADGDVGYADYDELDDDAA